MLSVKFMVNLVSLANIDATIFDELDIIETKQREKSMFKIENEDKIDRSFLPTKGKSGTGFKLYA
ncbi:MAG: hypothetical protein KAS13_07065 [Candidatus Omnitrophica bacterium]|nr:hypothetical protein [Candidatus Omnitrophota bacterium]